MQILWRSPVQDLCDSNETMMREHYQAAQKFRAQASRTLITLLGTTLAIAAIDTVVAALPAHALTSTMMDNLDVDDPGDPNDRFFTQSPGPGFTIERNQYQSDTNIFFFREVTNLPLRSNVNVDARTAGAGYSGINFAPSFLPIGTRTESYYFSFDPVTETGVSITASITFDLPIGGLIFLDAPPTTGFTTLDDTNAIFGRSGITYPNPAAQFLGVDFDPGITWSSDNRTLIFDLSAGSNGVDNVRVILIPFEFSPSLGLLALGAIAAGWHWRKRIFKFTKPRQTLNLKS
jgi:hypothetical protein